MGQASTCPAQNSTNKRIYTRNILSEDQLRKQVPSIFTNQAHENTSSKYALIPTIECVRGLQKAGFYPVKAQESRCRNAENQ